MPSFVTDFIEKLTESHQLERSTIKMYQYDILKFLIWYEKNNYALDFDKWRHLTQNDYQAYFTYLKKKNSSEANLKRITAALNLLLHFYNVDFHLTSTRKRQRPLSDDDFINEDEDKRLLDAVKYRYLNDKQHDIYPFIEERNQSILLLMLRYGLSVDEICRVNIGDINFSQNEIRVYMKDRWRTVPIQKDHKRILLSYYNSIPEPIRPKAYTKQAFFLPLNPFNCTFYYDYINEQPRRLSKRALQLLINNECKRAGLKRTISGTQLRNTAILNGIKEGMTNLELKNLFGMRTSHALLRYKSYIKS